MGRSRQGVDEQGIVPSEAIALLRQACPDLDDWPRRWQCAAADLAPGAAIVAAFTPFLLDLLRRKASKSTFNRDRNNLWLVGGEIIRRRHDDPDLKRLPIKRLLRQLIEEDGGPLIWPPLSETEQNAIDATCRKLYRFLNQSTAAN
ncbi:MAG: hypothetical protein WAL87_05295 [Chthoniobacterales bacterium]